MRKQFLLIQGRTIYGFVRKVGGKFSDCGCGEDISLLAECKTVPGLASVSLADNPSKRQQRAPLLGSSCQWVDLARLRQEGEGCTDGTKFVLKLKPGVRGSQKQINHILR